MQSRQEIEIERAIVETVITLYDAKLIEHSESVDPSRQRYNDIRYILVSTLKMTIDNAEDWLSVVGVGDRWK